MRIFTRNTFTTRLELKAHKKRQRKIEGGRERRKRGRERELPVAKRQKASSDEFIL